MALDPKILIFGALAALFLMGGKKSTKKSSTVTEGGEEPIDDGKGDLGEMPGPNGCKDGLIVKNGICVLNTGESKPAKDQKGGTQTQKPDGKSLTKGRKDLIDVFIEKAETYVALRPDPYGYYFKWAATQSNKSYYNWLTNQIYWQISFNEKKTDLFDADPVYTSSSLPFLLHDGERGYWDLNNKIFQIIKFNETSKEADKRLGTGEKLWLDIREYLKANMKKCPDGVVCK